MLINTTIKKLIGSAGLVDCAIELPEHKILGWALILHPHPLYGGNRNNKVITTISRECLRQGIVAVRPNFRGVGDSDGSFDNGVGETSDMSALMQQIIAIYPDFSELPCFLFGFSFGSAVAAQLYSKLYNDNKYFNIKFLMLIGSAVQRFQFSEIHLPEKTIIIHGETDEVVPFNEMLDWARPRSIPIIMIPSCSHFFHGKLLLLREMVSIYLKSSIISY
ncbi:MAG: alpha/beta hydrolase [Candidatus Kinetoplastibacterium crithidii]|nr:MAG: alpha/beta hydrolase [Candidatus Kinetoplastibacterium crithidii]